MDSLALIIALHGGLDKSRIGKSGGVRLTIDEDSWDNCVIKGDKSVMIGESIVLIEVFMECPQTVRCHYYKLFLTVQTIRL